MNASSCVKESAVYQFEQIFYLRNKKGHKVGCIAMGFNKREDCIEVDIAGSFVSNNDMFSKKAGRNMALGRLHSTNFATRKLEYTISDARKGFTRHWLNDLGLNAEDNYKEVDLVAADLARKSCLDHAEMEFKDNKDV